MPFVIKTSRGVNPRIADTAGAIAMYISWHPGMVGIAVTTVATPSQSIFLMFLKGTPSAVQKSLVYRSVCEAATPRGPAPMGSRSRLKKLAP